VKQAPPRQTGKHWLWNSPERSRLEGAIADATIALAQSEQKQEKWWVVANDYLVQARECLAAGNLHEGWAAQQSANRVVLLNSKKDNGLQLAAIQLRREVEKFAGWRAKAISDLICDKSGNLRRDIDPSPFTARSRMRVIEALALRDDQYQTDYFKIWLRRRHLFRLFLLLLAGIAASLALSYFGAFPDPFNKFQLMAGVVLFGVLGAALSVARSLLQVDLSAKIPAQQIGAFVIWMRPAIGGVAALISFVLVNAKVIRLFDWDPANPTIIFTVTMASGFSERFIIGAIEGIWKDKSGDNPRKANLKEASRKDKTQKKEGQQAGEN